MTMLRVNYWGQLQESIAHRGKVIPRIGGVVTLVATSVTLYILAALLIVPSDAVREFNFVNERGAVTALSAVFLAMASGLAGAAFFLSRGEPARQRGFWLLTTFGFGFLALDELLQFHERVGRLLVRLQLSPELFRNGSDTVVVVYGIGALALLAYFLPAVLRHSRLPELLGVALFFFVLHTVIDSTQEPPTSLSIILEESAKLFCGAFLALAAFAGLLAVVSSKQHDYTQSGLSRPRLREQ